MFLEQAKIIFLKRFQKNVNMLLNKKRFLSIQKCLQILIEKILIKKNSDEEHFDEKNSDEEN